MTLNEIMTGEQWENFQKNIHEKSGFNVAVFDADGILFSYHESQANKLCPVIENNENGKNAICVNANNNISMMAKKSKKPAIEECDAGIVKLAVPVISGDEFLGVVSCCGLRSEDVDVEIFLIHKLTGMNENEIAELAKSIKTVSEDDVNEAVKNIQDELNKYISK